MADRSASTTPPELEVDDVLRELRQRYEDENAFARAVCDGICRLVGHRSDHPLVRTFEMAAASQSWLQMQHDIRSLLSAVVANLGVVRDSLPEVIEGSGFSPEQRAHAIAEFRECVGDALSAADACAEISKDSDVLRSGSVGEVVSELRDTLGLCVRIAVRNAIRSRVHVRLVEGPAVIAAVPRWQLLQVVLNLISNGVDASTPEGSVYGGTMPEVVVTSWATPERAFVRVADSGPGIPPERVDRVFELFYTTKPTGTGLGMHICRQLVKGWSGTISYEDADDQGGAAFVFSVPIVERRP